MIFGAKGPTSIDDTRGVWRFAWWPVRLTDRRIVWLERYYEKQKGEYLDGVIVWGRVTAISAGDWLANPDWDQK